MLVERQLPVFTGIGSTKANVGTWPVTDRWLVVFDSWADGRDLMVADRP